MKTKEELNVLKNEVMDLNAKLAELNDDELKEVVGGIVDDYEAHRAFCEAYYALSDIFFSNRCSDQFHNIIEAMMDECWDAYTQPYKTVIETVNALKELQDKLINSRTKIEDAMISGKIGDILSDLYSKLKV